MSKLYLLPLLVAACTACWAGPVTVTMSGDYDPVFLGAAWPYQATHFSIVFSTDQNPPGVIPQAGGGAFSIPIVATYSSGAQSVSISGTAGWFRYSPVSEGLDVRLFPASGGYFQSIVELSATPYVGTDANPTVLLMDTPGTFILGYWYPNNAPAIFATGTNSHYTVADAVPEPAYGYVLLMCVTFGAAWRNRRPL